MSRWRAVGFVCGGLFFIGTVWLDIVLQRSMGVVRDVGVPAHSGREAARMNRERTSLTDPVERCRTISTHTYEKREPPQTTPQGAGRGPLTCGWAPHALPGGLPGPYISNVATFHGEGPTQTYEQFQVGPKNH